MIHVCNIKSKDKSNNFAVILDTYSIVHNSVSLLVRLLCMFEDHVSQEAEGRSNLVVFSNEKVNLQPSSFFGNKYNHLKHFNP